MRAIRRPRKPHPKFAAAFPAHFPRIKFTRPFPMARKVDDVRIERAWSHVSTEELRQLVSRGPVGLTMFDEQVTTAQQVHAVRKRALELRLEREADDGTL